MNAPRYLPVAPVSRSICVAHSQVNIVLESHLMQQKLHAHLLAPELLRSMRIGIRDGGRPQRDRPDPNGTGQTPTSMGSRTVKTLTDRKIV